MKPLNPGDRVRVFSSSDYTSSERAQHQDGKVIEVSERGIKIYFDIGTGPSDLWWHRRQCVPLKKRERREWDGMWRNSGELLPGVLVFVPAIRDGAKYDQRMTLREVRRARGRG